MGIDLYNLIISDKLQKGGGGITPSGTSNITSNGIYDVTNFASASTPMVNSTYTGSFGSIYVPASLVDSYKASANWSALSDRITAIIE